MKSIEIQSISGCTYPVYVFLSDIYKNYQTLLGIISSNPYPSTITYTTQIPQIFETANELALSLIDSNAVEYLKIIQCEGEPILEFNVIKPTIELNPFDEETTTQSVSISDKKLESSNLIYKILEEKMFNGILVQVVEILDKNDINISNKIRLLINKYTKDLIGWEMVSGDGAISYVLNKIQIL